MRVALEVRVNKHINGRSGREAVDHAEAAGCRGCRQVPQTPHTAGTRPERGGCPPCATGDLRPREESNRMAAFLAVLVLFIIAFTVILTSIWTRHPELIIYVGAAAAVIGFVNGLVTYVSRRR